MADDWEELITERDENQCKLYLNGNTVSKRLEKTDGMLLELLCKLPMLNFIEISDTHSGKLDIIEKLLRK